MTEKLFPQLGPNEQRGSKPRCHLLTHGSPEEVSKRLTDLIHPWGKVDLTDHWMPLGFTNTIEAQFGRADNLLNPSVGKSLVRWWLALPNIGRVPHWDIASTCLVKGQPGLLLIEAKAYDEELIKEEAGKKQEKKETFGQKRNREQIRDRMLESSSDFTDSTRMVWDLSIEHHYQMSNRFAWAWKLIELGMPVILVYLGFLNADEMSDLGKPFISHEAWDQLVLLHSERLFPAMIWNNDWLIHDRDFIPMIKSVILSLQKGTQ
jgi:hypothetical protein